MIIETDDGGTFNTHRNEYRVSAKRPELVVEFHYDDGDVGAYDDDIEQAYELWQEFSASDPKRHKPTHILIRLRNEDD